MNVSATFLKTSEETSQKDMDIQLLVKEASDFIGPVWPLKNGIACNPLLGLEHKQFWEAIALFDHLKPMNSPSEEKVNWHFIKWIQAFLDEGQAVWKMPDRHLGFYRSWLLLAPYDRLLIKTDCDRKTVALFSQDPQDAIQLGMKRLGIEENKVEYLARQLAQLPGWAGYVKWKAEWQEKPLKYPIDLVQFLAVRIVIACILENQTEEQKIEQQSLQERSWSQEQIESQENEYKQELIRNLITQAKKESFSFRKEHSLGQLIFCIDTRSESFRKHLEDQGNWETFGFAGFFGIPISLKKSEMSEKFTSCPVLLKPRHDVTELSHPSIFSKCRHRIKALLIDVYKNLKYQFGTPFALAEAIGPWSGIWMAFKAFKPQLAHTFQELFNEKQDRCSFDLEKSIPLKEQIEYAYSALSIIGLLHHFAPLVVFCGHGATVQNNPHASTLNCGACGGNKGGPNARLMASILNSSQVRSELKKRGIEIPKETLFIGAEHDTTTDNMTLFYHQNQDAKQQNLIQRLKEDLKKAQKANASTRMSLLGSFKGKKEAIQKSVDWSETRPEWGLARNAAFLVGPRTLTENLDLKSRCFLHSYDWRSDSQGTFLETILTAPMVVAEWINTQYFFSTFHPVTFGSGSKITHNVVGKIGVMQGNRSDLMHGLPLQSTYTHDREPYHIPMRLLTVVLAPRTRIDAIVKKHTLLQHLFFNEWVKLVAIDPTDLKSYQLRGKEIWKEIQQ